ncbi:MAG: PTS sugar transporter subunit IIC [Bacilli bacterium]
MNNFTDKIAELLMPIAQKFASQRHLVAIRDGFISIMPIVLIASFYIFLNNVILDPTNGFLKSFGDFGQFKDIGMQVYYGTLGIMSILLAFTVSYKLAEGYGKEGLIPGVMGVATLVTMFPLVQTVGGDAAVEVSGMFSEVHTSATGLFVGILAAILGTELFLRLQKNEKLGFRMPESVPPTVIKSFNALIPAFIVLTIFGTFTFVLHSVWELGIHDIITMVIQKPIEFIFQGLPGILAVLFAQNLLWAFGLHGAFILSPITEPTLLAAITENMAAVQAGLDAPNIVTKSFLDVFGFMGGGGMTFGLILAILLASRRAEYRSMAKLGIAPGLFNINEPLVFGLPVVFNPILGIPLILAPMVNVTIAYLATAAGLVAKTTVLVPWTTPPVLGAFFATGGDWRAAVLAIILLTVSVLVYLPFVIASNKAQSMMK